MCGENRTNRVVRGTKRGREAGERGFSHPTAIWGIAIAVGIIARGRIRGKVTEVLYSLSNTTMSSRLLPFLCLPLCPGSSRHSMCYMLCIIPRFLQPCQTLSSGVHRSWFPALCSGAHTCLIWHVPSGACATHTLYPQEYLGHSVEGR